MMELNHAEQVALFEGLMECGNTESSSRCSRDAGLRKSFSRWDLSAHPERQAGTVMWRSALASTSTAGGMSGMARDDDLCSWSYNPPKDDQVAELSRYLQEFHFPLLEQPECRSDELFPAIWE